jgi:hypothetical protein
MSIMGLKNKKRTTISIHNIDILEIEIEKDMSKILKNRNIL